MINYKQYIVVGGYYDNKSGLKEFIQALGVYDNIEQAYGKAILYLNESVDDKRKEYISPIYPLESDVGFGMDLEHEKITDYVYVLFCEEDEKNTEK